MPLDLNAQVPQAIIDQWNKITSRINKEGIQSNIGQTLVAPGVISATSLQNAVTPATLPTAPNPTPVPPVTPVPEATTQESDMAKLFKQYLGEQTPPPSLSDTYNTEYATAGIDEKQQKVNDLTAQINAIAAEQQAQELKFKEEGISAGAIAGRNYDLERQNAIRVLPLKAQLDAAQGNLTAAQDKLNTLFEIKKTDATNQYNYKQKLIDSVYNFATEQEKTKLEEKKLQNTQKYNEEKDRLATINNLAQSYPDAGITSEDSFENAQSKVINSPSFQAKLKTGGGLTDYQTTQTFLNISNKYQADSIVKQAVNGQTAVAISDQIIKDPSKATSQLASLYLLVKNLDPTSAVREGELALANQTQSYLQQFGNTLARIGEGRVIAPDAALQLAKATKELANAWNTTANARTKQYQSQANTAGVGGQFSNYLGGYSSQFSTNNNDTPPKTQEEANNILNQISQAPKQDYGLVGKLWNWLTTTK